jgi:hypothetical protein
MRRQHTIGIGVLFLFPLLPALSGCASGGTSTAAAPSNVVQTVQTATSAGDHGALNSVPETSAIAATVSAPFASVWNALPAVYDSLGIKVATLDPKGRVVGNGGFKAHHELGKARLSRYIDCGNAQGSPSADSYEIQLSVLTQVSAAGANSTSLATTVQAVGRPITVVGDFSPCSSNGVLEPLIAKMVSAQLGAK